MSRTPKANGRINRLIVSIIMRTGIRGSGVPSGSKCPRATVGWFRIPIITVASHSGTANPIFNDSWVVGVKVYGRSPSRLVVIKNNIKDVRRIAHLWPPTLRGINSCCVKRLMNHPCRVNNRLFSQREEGVG